MISTIIIAALAGYGTAKLIQHGCCTTDEIIDSPKKAYRFCKHVYSNHLNKNKNTTTDSNN